MTYGRYTPFVNEVIDFAKTGAILAPTAARPNGVMAVEDLAEAEFLATEQAYGEAEYLWTDIRELEMSQIRAHGYQNREVSAWEETLSGQLTLLTPLIRKRLGARYAGLLDDVVADLQNCALVRAIGGKRPGFFETLFSVYAGGGWPCGWDGKYPDGRVASFFPKVKERETG
jgi:hypothetical protein